MTTRSEAVTRPPEPAPGTAPPVPPSAPLAHQVLDAIEQGVVALDRERKVVYANRWIEDLLGLEPQALIGLSGART